MSSFETAYARNSIIEESSVNSVNVEVQGGFDVTTTKEGFLGHANIQVMYTKDAGEQTATGDEKYTANYFVSKALAYRVESDVTEVDPRDRQDSQLVACFE